MIKAEIHTNGERIIGFAILGHSGTAPRGRDIYCAGVSSLSQSATLALIKHLKCKLKFVQASGNLTVKLTEEPTDLTEAVFQTMLLGLMEIEKLNPKALKVSIDGDEQVPTADGSEVLQVNLDGVVETSGVDSSVAV